MKDTTEQEELDVMEQRITAAVLHFLCTTNANEKDIGEVVGLFKIDKNRPSWCLVLRKNRHKIPKTAREAFRRSSLDFVKKLIDQIERGEIMQDPRKITFGNIQNLFTLLVLLRKILNLQLGNKHTRHIVLASSRTVLENLQKDARYRNFLERRTHYFHKLN